MEVKLDIVREEFHSEQRIDEHEQEKQDTEVSDVKQRFLYGFEQGV
jgi:hypothetical protein